MGLGQGTPGQPKYLSWGRLELVGRRPTTMVVRPGPWVPPPLPAMCLLLIGSQGQFQVTPLQFPTEERVAPTYICEGRGSISTHPPSATSSLLFGLELPSLGRG